MKHLIQQQLDTNQQEINVLRKKMKDAPPVEGRDNYKIWCALLRHRHGLFTQLREDQQIAILTTTQPEI